MQRPPRPPPIISARRRPHDPCHSLSQDRGGPEVLIWEEIQVGKPGPGEARIRHTAVGLNFVDIYNRSGLYPVQLPSGLGAEGAGVVEEVGPGVADLKPGDRVAYGSSPLGAYAEARLIPADRLHKLPDSIDDKTAAAMMLKGLTTQYLDPADLSGEGRRHHPAARGRRRRRHHPQPVGKTSRRHRDRHLRRQRGKRKLAKSHGCDHVILYNNEDFVARVTEITGGKKVPVVYDSVGKDTFAEVAGLSCALRPCRAVRPIVRQCRAAQSCLLAQKGSLYVTRPTLQTYGAKRENLVGMGEELFDVVGSGAVKIEVHQTYPLKDAAKAHADLAARRRRDRRCLLV